MLTRIITVALALVTSIGYAFFLEANGLLVGEPGFFQYMVIVSCYCAGAALVMWLAELINASGIGNGISMILFANIISRGPALVGQIIAMVFPTMNLASFKWTGLILAIVSVVITLAIVVLVVWFTESERRIPIQYAKRVVGRKMYGGQSSNLPIKLNMTGVMPVIFASSIVSIPATIASFFPDSGFWKSVTGVFNYDGWLYLVLYLVLIVLFAYFYVMISFNPVEVANNIQKNGGSIPGIRSGRPTVQYIKKILNRITLIGAIFLCFIAGFPMIINIITSALGTSFAGLAFGGNSLLIVVGVALETHRDLEAQVALRNYGGSKSKGIFG
jgi:preprotein translocase subunit SecY